MEHIQFKFQNNKIIVTVLMLHVKRGSIHFNKKVHKFYIKINEQIHRYFPGCNNSIHKHFQK